MQTFTTRLASETPLEAIQGAVAGITASRGEYDSRGNDKHAVAALAYRFLRCLYSDLPEGCGVQFIYKALMCLKQARLVLIAEKGKVHYDSLLDGGGYAWLLADKESQDDTHGSDAVRDETTPQGDEQGDVHAARVSGMASAVPLLHPVDGTDDWKSPVPSGSMF